MTETPAYLRIAADIRGKIVSGELAPGARLPSHSEIQGTYGVSSTVARTAISVLKSEGLIEGRTGSGLYVRTVQRRLVRESGQRSNRGRDDSTSPFARDSADAAQAPTWEHHSEHATAGEDVARRLRIDPGSPVMRTAYLFRSDGLPVQLSTSWEPLAITGGTDVEWPEDGAAVGVVSRMDLIGVRVDEFVEVVIGRAATPEEIRRLDLSLRGQGVLAVERTYYAAGRPVETADIVFATDRYQLQYRVPVE